MQRAALQKARDGSQLRQVRITARVRAFHSAVWTLELWRSGSAVDLKPIWAQQQSYTALHAGGRNGARAQRDSAVASVGIATRQWGKNGRELGRSLVWWFSAFERLDYLGPEAATAEQATTW